MISKKLVLICTLGAACAVSTKLPAQIYGGYYGNQPYYNGYGGGYHASTAAESYSRGLSSVIQAQGEKNLMDSEARKNNEQARSAYLDNRVKSVETYWKRREIYNEQTEEKLYKASLERQQRLAKVKLTDISPQELNPSTGAVTWPSLLASDRYDPFRGPLEELLAKRSQYGALSVEDLVEAKTLIRSWRGAVTADRAAYPDELVRSALRFLLKLDRNLDENFS